MPGSPPEETRHGRSAVPGGNPGVGGRGRPGVACFGGWPGAGPAWRASRWDSGRPARPRATAGPASLASLVARGASMPAPPGSASSAMPTQTSASADSRLPIPTSARDCVPSPRQESVGRRGRVTACLAIRGESRDGKARWAAGLALMDGHRGGACTPRGYVDALVSEARTCPKLTQSERKEPSVARPRTRLPSQESLEDASA